jgi:hypothetical protein
MIGHILSPGAALQGSEATRRRNQRTGREPRSLTSQRRSPPRYRSRARARPRSRGRSRARLSSSHNLISDLDRLCAAWLSRGAWGAPPAAGEASAATLGAGRTLGWATARCRVPTLGRRPRPRACAGSCSAWRRAVQTRPPRLHRGSARRADHERLHSPDCPDNVPRMIHWACRCRLPELPRGGHSGRPTRRARQIKRDEFPEPVALARARVCTPVPGVGGSVGAGATPQCRPAPAGRGCPTAAAPGALAARAQTALRRAEANVRPLDSHATPQVSIAPATCDQWSDAHEHVNDHCHSWKGPGIRAVFSSGSGRPWHGRWRFLARDLERSVGRRDV